MYNIGTRVGAILTMDKDTVTLIGYGVYEGDFPLGDVTTPTPVGDVAAVVAKGGRPNPRIKLDSGSYVWGCECWWGPEDKVRASIGSRKLIEVDIESIRKEFASNS